MGLGAASEVPPEHREDGHLAIPPKEPTPVDHEHPDRMYNVAGPTRDYQAIVQFEKPGDEPNFVRLQGTIILKPEAVKGRGKSPKETTLIFLHAVKLALETAKKLNAGFHWSFSPTDPERKMTEWQRKYLDSGEIKKEVGADEVGEELKKITQKIAELDSVDTHIEITDVDNPDEYSDRMVERLNQVQKEIKESL